MWNVARRTLAVGILALFAGGVWAQDLPSDPALTTGKLDNGLTYLIRQHDNPPGRASIWIHFHTGSLNETDAQRGLAHYLEHMAFNGSANFPPGSVVPFFQSLGLTFGRDQNAFTSFEQTTYQLSLPSTDPEMLNKGMQFFADVLGRLSLNPAEIESERQIIQEERRRSLSGRQRTMYHVLEHIAPGSLYGQRITIGTEETIDSVTQKDFQDYYGKWYTAANATVIVVADTAPEKVAELIRQNFGDAPKKPRPTPQDSGVRAYEKSFAIVASDAEVQSESIQIVRLDAPRPPTTSVAQYRSELVAQLAQMAFNRRIDARVAAGETSYLGGNVSISNEPGMLYSVEFSGQAAPGKWRASLNELAMELQRARKFGFSDREVEDAKTQMLTRAQRAVETEPTRQASMFLFRINSAVTNGEPIMSAKQERELLTRLLPEINTDEITQRFAAEFDPRAVAFVAILPEGPGVPTEEELLAAGTAALAIEPQPLEEAARPTELLATLPAPGQVAEGAAHEASGVWSGWLSNNVRVHHRFMDTQKNDVTISVALIGGELLENAGNRGITDAATVAWSRPATKHLTSSDIRDLMNDKKVSVRGGSGGGRRGGRRGGGGGGSGDSISLSISGSPEDLEYGLQLAYLLLTEPKIESAAFTQFKTRSEQMIEESKHNPMRLGMRLASGAPYPADDARTQPVTLEQLERLTEAGAQAWLEQLVATSPVEVAIVGDMPRQEAVDLVAKYIGALPGRERVSDGLFADRRELKRPAGPRAIRESVQTETPQAFVMSAFYGPDENDTADVRAMAVAARILSTRMVKEIREDAQLVYSISAGLRPGTTYPGFGLVSAASPTEPAKVQPLVDKIAEMYATLARDGVSPDELDVARKQFANTLEEQMRENGYWLGRMAQMTFRGTKLDDIVDAPEAYEAITADEVHKTFAKYYDPAKSIIVVVTPEETAEDVN